LRVEPLAGEGNRRPAANKYQTYGWTSSKMNVRDWSTPAPFFPWPHVQAQLEQIDAQVYRLAMEFAQEQFREEARDCPTCGHPAQELFWLGVDAPDEAWRGGEGQSGFLTVCTPCRAQVDFLVDPELTEAYAENLPDESG
jgi:hypothetical protein